MNVKVLPETKECKKCKIVKASSEYMLRQQNSDGLYSYCHPCRKEDNKDTYNKHKEARLARANNYYYSNKQKIIDYQKQNADHIKEAQKVYREKNSTVLNEKKKQYRLINYEKELSSSREYKQKNKELLKQKRKEKYQKFPILRLYHTLCIRLSDFIKDRGYSKTSSYTKSIGCTREQLKAHLSSQFKDGMTWDNYGTVWHVDHKIPLSKASTVEQAYSLQHYLNLQPLFCGENLSKNATRSDVCWQKLQRDKLIEQDKKDGYNFELKARQFTLSHEFITNEHREFIKKYEWLGTIGYGVRQVFTARHDGKLGAVVMMAEPNTYQFEKKLECLVQRGAAASWAPKNLNSRLLMFACKWMVNNTSKRIFVGYSDFDAGEYGTIYQACGFDYLGQEYGSKLMYVLHNGKKVNSRHFTRTSSMKKYAKELGITWHTSWTKENRYQNIDAIPTQIRQQLLDVSKSKMNECRKVRVAPKGKYVLLLKKQKEQIVKNWVSQQYPKRSL